MRGRPQGRDCSDADLAPSQRNRRATRPSACRASERAGQAGVVLRFCGVCVCVCVFGESWGHIGAAGRAEPAGGGRGFSYSRGRPPLQQQEWLLGPCAAERVVAWSMCRGTRLVAAGAGPCDDRPGTVARSARAGNPTGASGASRRSPPRPGAAAAAAAARRRRGAMACPARSGFPEPLRHRGA